MSSLSIFEERHMISLLMYIADNDGCSRTEIYRDVARSQRMPEKIDALEKCGLVATESGGNMVTQHITDRGRRVVRSLRDLDVALNN